MNGTRHAVLLDLDGTLTDPFIGITASLQYALEKMGADVPEPEALRWCIGPPLWDSFKVLLETDDHAVADRAVKFYRERYTTVGLFENQVYPGVPDMLDRLKAAGLFLSLATSKPISYASRIVEHFGLADYFDALHGAELDGRNSDKATLIAYVLDTENLVANRSVMVGDRKHDVIGARANGVDVFAVSYGYGDAAELSAHVPDAICNSPANVAETVLDWSGMAFSATSG